MEQKSVKIVYHKALDSELDAGEREMLDLALASAAKAYAPYSKFSVGAVVQLSDGSYISGNNQENAAYPSGLCAERVALFYANATHPELPVTRLAVLATVDGEITEEPVPPCGACRQVLLETEQRYEQVIRIYLVGRKQIYILESAADLLPLSFDSKLLGD